jgi:histidinol dehydrogenase
VSLKKTQRTAMKIIQHPRKEDWADILARPKLEQKGLDRSVRKIMEAVKKRGDRAVRKYTQEFDGVKLRRLEVTDREIRDAEKEVDKQLKEAILQAAKNIKKFHDSQRQDIVIIETMPGVECWRKSIAIDTVGLYIPGGTAPLFSTILMLGIPATLAGCREIILCSPPDAAGKLHPAILFAAKLVGVKKIFKVGGVQAIAAMTYGTDSIPKVDKIFGPGNQYVTAAKQFAQQEGMAIDMPAGPSEVCVLADKSANPVFVSADLLSQAEHGKDSQVLLVSDDPKTISRILEEVKLQVELLGRRELAEAALENSKAILVDDLHEGMAIVNAYAPEHLIIACADDEKLAGMVTSAGSVFLGHYTPESAGDYASGTNHTLPTNGHANAYSGVSFDSFVKKVTFQKISKEGLQNLGGTIVTMADAEGLQAHADAVRLRLRG